MAKLDKKMDDEISPEDFAHGHEDGCCGDPSCPGESGCGGYWEPEYQHHGRGGKAMLAFSASLLFLLMAIFVGMQIWGNPWYKNIRAEFTSTPYARTITIDGEGKITVKPDIAKVSLSVASAGKTVKEVTDDNNTKMNAVISQMKQLGIKPEDIQTSSYDLYPQYDYGNSGVVSSGMMPVPPRPVTPKIVGYNLTQTVVVKIRDLTKSDQVLDQAIASGVNQVGALTFELDDASKVKKDARIMAFQKAKDKAQEMASAAEVSLGRVITFSESSAGGAQPYANFAMKAMSSADAAPAPSIEPGSQDFTVDVSVTYEIN